MFFYCLLNILLNHGLKPLIFIALEEMVGNSLLWFKDYFFVSGEWLVHVF